MEKKQNIICRFLGHQYVRTVSNRLYYVDTCIRCGETKKRYYQAEDHNIKKVKVNRY